MSKSIAFVLLVLSSNLLAANLDAEYEQVRRIALRDPKVRAAYDAADRKLAARIVEIDPALKGYKPGKSAPVAKAPAPAPKIKGAKHKVEQGETLESIAARYRVGVPTLKEANPGVQERRLQVGQVLIVPKKSTAPPATGSPKPAARKQSWWQELLGD